ncbi:MAG: hypothetical protein EAZ57_10725 [Cytophagales bacterium]|nr:MAG: hypothetical protein EAZ67_11330 [Cytophagales bacterium]TAF59549.1 MAG: hypothetical protein EAZ57_10725 [Cytophagales bacterium]
MLVRNFYLQICTFALLLVCSMSADILRAQGAYLIVDTTQHVRLYDFAEYCVAPTQGKNIKDIVGLPFVPFSPEWKPTPGQDTHWLRFSLNNSHHQAINMLLSVDHWDFATIYHEQGDDLWTSKESGILMPYWQRPLQTGHAPYLQIVLNRMGEQTYYLKLENKSNFHRNNQLVFKSFESLSIRNFESVERDYEERRFWQGIYIGAMLLMTFYNLSLFVFLRDKNYLFYSLFIFFDVFANAILEGFALEYIWPSFPYWNLYSAYPIYSLSWIFFDIFIIFFLNIRQTAKNWTFQLIIGLALAKVLFIVLALFDIWAITFHLAAVTISVVVILMANIIAIRNKYRPARFLLLANIFFLLGFVIQTLAAQGLIIQNMYTLNATQFGDVLQILIFSLALSDRINAMRDELEEQRIKQERLKYTQEMERKRIAEEQKIQLELEVKRRTQEIEAINDELVEQKAELEKNQLEIKQAYNDIMVISEVGKDITSELGIKSIVARVYEHINKLMDAHVFAIGMYDQQEQSLTFDEYLVNGEAQNKVVLSLDEEDRISLWCLINKKPLFINDFDLEYSLYLKSKKPSKIVESRQSLLYFPLETEHGVIGVLTVQSLKKNAYNQKHFKILESLAAYIAIALDNTAAYLQIDEDKKEIELQNRQITASLRYASDIQEILLPSEEVFIRFFKESFIIYKPKDIVSGDFYWVREFQQNVFLAVGDCTGHGVPGAFMTMLGISLLDQIVLDFGYAHDLVGILNSLNENIQKLLKQDAQENSDGMDIALSVISPSKDTPGRKQIVFAGAKRNLYYFRDSKSELFELKGAKKSIGGSPKKRSNQTFTQESITLSVGNELYFTTDGFADQASETREKIGSTKLKQALALNANKDMSFQKNYLLNLLQQHQGEADQRDDITIIGLRL